MAGRACAFSSSARMPPRPQRPLPCPSPPPLPHNERRCTPLHAAAPPYHRTPLHDAAAIMPPNAGHHTAERRQTMQRRLSPPSPHPHVFACVSVCVCARARWNGGRHAATHGGSVPCGGGAASGGAACGGAAVRWGGVTWRVAWCVAVCRRRRGGVRCGACGGAVCGAAACGARAWRARPGLGNDDRRFLLPMCPCVRVCVRARRVLCAAAWRAAVRHTPRRRGVRRRGTPRRQARWRQAVRRSVPVGRRAGGAAVRWGGGPVGGVPWCVPVGAAWRVAFRRGGAGRRAVAVRVLDWVMSAGPSVAAPIHACKSGGCGACTRETG